MRIAPPCSRSRTLTMKRRAKQGRHHHGSTPRPIDTANRCSAVHMTVDAFAFGCHGNSFGTVDVLVTATSFSRPCTCCARHLEAPSRDDENGIQGHQRLHKNGDPKFCLCLPTRKIVMSSPLHVLVRHSDSGLGSMSRFAISSILSFTPSGWKVEAAGHPCADLSVGFFSPED